MNDVTINCGVLVCGGGISGLLAAIRAKEFVDDVILISKATAGRSGCSYWAAGTMMCCLPSDDEDLYLKDILETSELLDAPNMARVVVRGSYLRILDMENFGVPWVRDQNGKILRKSGIGMKYSQNAMFRGGAMAMWALRGEAVRRGVRILDRVTTTHLLTSDGKFPTRDRVVGCMAFNNRNGKIYCISSKATVLATGDWNLKRVHAPDDNTGDGQAIAFRAGAVLRCMDQFGYTIATNFEGHVSALHFLLGHGAHLINNRGETYMEKYDPVLRERASRPMLTRAAAIESAEGRGPIFIDCRNLPKSMASLIKEIVPRFYYICQAAGYNVMNDPIPFEHVPFGNGAAGGLRISPKGETDLPGLFAGGGVTDRVGYIGTVGLNGASVFGYLAGESAGSYAKSQPLGPAIPAQIRECQDEISNLIGIGNDRQINDLTHEVRRICHEDIGIIKSKEKLERAETQLNGLIEMEIPKMRASNPHHLSKLYDIRNITFLAMIAAHSSLLRTESRYFNYREDFPKRDDQQWLKYILTQINDNQSPEYTFEGIPK
jgi:succinate dehydrogenase / fumarate reductase, flavoprotein subunit